MKPTPAASPCSALRAALLIRGFLVTIVLLAGVSLRGAEASIEPATADYRLPDNPQEMLRLDDEMRAFFGARVQRKKPLEVRLDAIAASILGEGGLHFRYEVDGVYDVREAFRRRRGNCVTYSMLLVAVAREFGISAVFNEVKIAPRWNRVGAIVIESRHINVWVDAPNGGYELDLKLPDELRASRTSATVVSDERALAGAYSNAGVYRLAAGAREAAFALLERAVAIDPSASGAWANLGAAHLIVDSRERARDCFERALDCNPATMSALSALARLERESGRSAEADRLERKVRGYRERNPYYLFAVARDELEGGRPEAARRHLSRAISLKADEPEFYEAMIEVARRLGAERDANRWARRLGGFRDVVAVFPR